MKIPPMPGMTEQEVLDRAAPLLGAGLADMDYADVVRVLTAASYVADLCIRVLGDRGQIEFHDGVPGIPDARPDSLVVENVIIQRGN